MISNYYPFGLTFNSYKRTASTAQNFLYNQGTGDKTFNTERVFELGVDMTKFRMYDYPIGRFWQIDPASDMMGQEIQSPYQYSFNNPIRYNDPYGDCIPCLVPAIAAKYSDVMAVVQSNASESRSALSRLVSGSSGSQIPSSSASSGSSNSLSTKQAAVINDVGTISSNTAESTKIVANEVSKDGIAVMDATGTALQLTPLKPVGSLISGVATIADEARQVALEDKDVGDALTDVAVKGSINMATGKLGNVAKKGADKITGGSKLNDKIVNTYETVIDKTATETYNEATKEKE